MGNLRLFSIYLASFILLSLSQRDSSSFKRKDHPYPQLVNSKRKEFQNKGLERESSALLMAYVLGDKRQVSKNLKRAHRDLNLLHLFTPSGLHLSALLVCLTPLFWWLKKRSRPAFYLFFNAINFLPFLLNDFFAIKRISLLRLSFFWGSPRLKRISSFGLFLIAFTLDFLLGTYRSSPLSFSFSFLFLGIIFATTQSSKLSMMTGLFGGQIIAGYFFLTPQTYLGFIFGFFLCFLFTLLFPLFLVHFFLSFLPTFNLNIWLVSLYTKLLLFFSSLAQYSGYFLPTLDLIFFVILISFIRHKFLPLLLIFHAQPLYNLPLSTLKQVHPPKHKASSKSVKKVSRTRRGYKVHYQGGSVCYEYLQNSYYSRRCENGK